MEHEINSMTLGFKAYDKRYSPKVAAWFVTEKADARTAGIRFVPGVAVRFLKRSAVNTPQFREFTLATNHAVFVAHSVLLSPAKMFRLLRPTTSSRTLLASRRSKQCRWCSGFATLAS